MFERALNVFWVLLGAAAAAYAWTLGIVGPAGPESGLFPLIAGLIIMGSGIALMLMPSQRAEIFDFPRGAALQRVIGVVLGLAWLAIAMPYLGFAIAGVVTMLVLLRAVERVSWTVSLGLAVASVAAVSWLFGDVLGMALPRGPWGF
ncbi:MAG TPA: tripartite tricarboxylate transporter TctB family protein [Xanthobacteraceae bacterium]|nr:tripartite tricarboxylate transporter TctB family protein [Xanthobacteraceae bacterium]